MPQQDTPPAVLVLGAWLWPCNSLCDSGVLGKSVQPPEEQAILTMSILEVTCGN